MGKKIVAHINVVNLSFKERLLLILGTITGKIGLNIYDETMRGLGFVKEKE